MGVMRIMYCQDYSWSVPLVGLQGDLGTRFSDVTTLRFKFYFIFMPFFVL